MRRVICLVLGLISFFSTSYAQEDSARIYVRARVQKNAILLRWAPATPMAWKKTNRCGFRIERYTVVRNKILLSQPERKILGTDIVKAEPLEEWMSWIEKNDNAAVVAQALYGEDFQLTGEDAQGLTRIVNLAQELEQRFTFSLYAADQDFNVACMAGWGWRDTSVRKGEYYLYRIIPATAKDSIEVKSGSIYTSLDEYRALPRPSELTAIWENKAVILMWNYARLSDYYNSYYIEKSSDGKNFQRLSGRPVSNLNDRTGKGTEKLIYVDSLPDNEHTFYYRVRGINPFGEEGPASMEISGKGINTLPYVPMIRRSVVNEAGKMEMEWEFDEKGEELIAGFELCQVDRADGEYQVVVKNISPVIRSLVYDELYESNYFKIRAVALEGEPTLSYPVLIQPLDTLPPLPPAGLRGEIDTAGVVKLHWNCNTEKDLLGYIVYKANRPAEEPIALFDVAQTDTCFTDTVEVINLNTKVYYYVVAVDKRYNRSGFSEKLELVKPDVIPPVSPLISSYHISHESIEVSWIPSPDEDVVAHFLFRFQQGIDSLPMEILRYKGSTMNHYVDTGFLPGAKCIYSIQAIDRSGLLSAATPSLTVWAPKNRKQNKQIDRFDAVVDKKHLIIKLLWTHRLKNVKNYEIYRSEGEEPMALWKTLPGWQNDVLDNEIAISTTYHYILRALFEEGGNSSVKKLEIKL